MSECIECKPGFSICYESIFPLVILIPLSLSLSPLVARPPLQSSEAHAIGSDERAQAMADCALSLWRGSLAVPRR